MSAATIANQSDTALAAETVAVSIPAGLGLFFGGEAVIGVGSAGGLLGGGLTALFQSGGAAATATAAGGTAVGFAETPEGQELISEGESLAGEGVTRSRRVANGWSRKDRQD